MSTSAAIWTIGHSNHSFARFAELLEGEAIEFVVDVRSYPYSRIAPHFNREDFEPALRERNLRYLFLGEELGGRPQREDQYDEAGHALYGEMADEPAFKEAVERLVRGSLRYRIALVCSEGQPQDCHRRLLVGRVLTARGIELRHILPSGNVRREGAVTLPGDDAQPSLFGLGAPAWRSTQSVSRRRRLKASSAA